MSIYNFNHKILTIINRTYEASNAGVTHRAELVGFSHPVIIKNEDPAPGAPEAKAAPEPAAPTTPAPPAPAAEPAQAAPELNLPVT